MQGVEGAVSVCRRSSGGSVCRGGCVVEEGATRESLLEVVELGKLNQTLLLHAPGHVTQRVLIFRNFSFQNLKVCLGRTFFRSTLKLGRYAAPI